MDPRTGPSRSDGCRNTRLPLAGPRRSASLAYTVTRSVSQAPTPNNRFESNGSATQRQQNFLGVRPAFFRVFFEFLCVLMVTMA
jgi:hypothetical protein